MEDKEIRKAAKELDVRWKKIHFLDEKIADTNHFSFTHQRRKINVVIQGNRMKLTLANPDRRYYRNIAIIKKGDGKEIATVYVNEPYFAVNRESYSNSSLGIVDFGSVNLEEAISFAVDSIVLNGEYAPLNEEKAFSASSKALDIWKKLDILDQEISKYNDFSFIRNGNEINVKINSHEMRIYLGDSPSALKIDDSYSSYRVGNGGGDRFGQSFDNYGKTNDLDKALTFAIDTVVAPTCSTRELKDDWDVLPGGKHSRWFPDENAYTPARSLSFQLTRKVCFLPVDSKEGIMFQLGEEFETCRFLVPMPLDKIHTVEQEILYSRTHCCEEREALVIQGQRENPEWEYLKLQESTTFFHKLDKRQTVTKESLSFILSDFDAVASSEKLSKIDELKFKGILAISATQYGKMDFTAVWTREDNGKTKKVFYQHLPSRGVIKKADDLDKVPSLLSRLDRSIVPDRLSKIQFIRDIKELQARMAEFVYSDKVRDVLGE
jgi:hypothetical protein